MTHRRVHVIGTSGSGKTTVAGAIADKLGIRHIELDAIHWQPRWTELPDDEFMERVSEAIQGDAWTIDGNYRTVRHLIWERVDTIVWLDMPFIPVLLRMLWRTTMRIVTREELWNTNTEGMDALIGKDSMPLWVIKTHKRRREEYPPLLASPELSHVDIKVFKSLKEVDAWIESLGD
jgi:adenylate kinase family enzyme